MLPVSSLHPRIGCSAGGGWVGGGIVCGTCLPMGPNRSRKMSPPGVLGFPEIVKCP